MQKSKSSSNVGQFVTRKILKRRSKSQTRSSTQTPFTKWGPAEKFTWASENGDRLLIQDSCLQNLTDIEAKILRRVALEKINELSIGANILLDNDGQQQKRWVLPKKKAITTSFFDISKKEEQSGANGIFGNSLECCLINDMKRNLKELSERGSRNSIASLFRSGSGTESSSKLHENVRSYESLPPSTFSLASPHGGDKSIDSGRASGSKSGCGYFGNISKFTSMQMQISQSQSDIRRRSQDFDLQRFKLQDCTSFREPHEMSENSLQVPTFISSCIKYLEEYGLHMVGLFRVSTSKKRVKQMREDFDKNSMTAIKAETSPHDVATLLKEFLRDLPEPLLCSGLYKVFLETQKIRNRRLQLEAISHLVKLLPVAHRDTLFVLLKFLAKVASCSDDVSGHGGNIQISGNKMDSNNLATVFAPNILRTSLKSSSNTATADIAACGTSNEQESMSDAINVIRIMIDHYEEIFKVPAELIDIVYSHMLDEAPKDLYCLCQQRSQSLREDIGNYCASPSSPEQIISPPPTTVALSTKVTTKHLYTRESVMHDNDASRVPETAMNRLNNAGRFPNKQTNRHSISEKLRHYERRDSVKNFDIVDRRQSFPNILDKSGVVSATLQIPVPVAQAGLMKLAAGSSQNKQPLMLSSEQSVNGLNEVYNSSPGTPKTVATTITSSYDCSETPYIEDAVTSPELEILNQYSPISGLLSFSTKVDVSANDCRQVQFSQQKQQKQHHQKWRNRTSRLRMNSSSQPSLTIAMPFSISEIDAPSSVVMGGAKVATYDPHLIKISGSNDPKLPTSISSIGSAILRSKTADFERMPVNNQQREVQPTSFNITTTTASTAMISTTTTTARPHLYKRQELIPSAKRGIARK